MGIGSDNIDLPLTCKEEALDGTLDFKVPLEEILMRRYVNGSSVGFGDVGGIGFSKSTRRRLVDSGFSTREGEDGEGRLRNALGGEVETNWFAGRALYDWSECRGGGSRGGGARVPSKETGRRWLDTCEASACGGD